MNKIASLRSDLYRIPLPVTLTDSTISGNSAVGGSGGGIESSGSTVTLTGSTITGNSAAGLGGGLYASDGTANRSQRE